MVECKLEGLVRVIFEGRRERASALGVLVIREDKINGSI